MRFPTAVACGLILFSGSLAAQETGPVVHPLEPPDTSSPRATLETFLTSLDQALTLYTAGDPDFREPLQRATRCLDLSQVPPRFLEATSYDSTLLLKEVLDRIELPPPAEIPGRAEVLAAGIERWTLPHTEIDVVQMSDGPRAGDFLFSAETVARSRETFERVRELPYRPGRGGARYDELRFGAKSRTFAAFVARLPAWLRAEAGGQLVWQWCMLALLAVLTLLLAALAILLGRRLAASEHGLVGVIGAYLGPLALLSLQWLIPPLAPWRYKLGGPGVRAVGAVLVVLALVGAAWLAAVVFRHAAQLTIRLTGSQLRPLNQQLIRVCARILSLAAIAVIAFHAGQSVGIPVSALVTGLGIGGLAVALAARHTLENVLGGINLFADQPVRIGELCKFGGRTGTVESIGLRSTRVRTRGRALISIPNSEFAHMALENLSRRDRHLLRARLRLALDIGPPEVESLLDELRATMRADERVAEKPFRVRLLDLGPEALEIEIFVYVLTRDWNEYLEIRERLLLAALRAVEAAGLRLAPPIGRYDT